MSCKLNLVYFAHSLRSDWNNGNAHFLRGLLSNLVKLGHAVIIYEQEGSWSYENLQCESAGKESLKQFYDTYPELSITPYQAADTMSGREWRIRLQQADFVIFHEWNPPELAQTLLSIRQEVGFRLVFHDTHHRVSSSPQQIRSFCLNRFDGVLAFGEALRNQYQHKFHIDRVWTLHEAADTDVFRPQSSILEQDDVVWIGNWGEGERSVEIRRFLLQPSKLLRHRQISIHGVRYPEDGLLALRDAGVFYGGYLPNLAAPARYASSRLTVHIPRQQYVTSMAGIPTIRVFEALACGIPLISAPWEDSEHLFREDDFIRVHSGDEMRGAMEYLLSDGKAAMALALRGLDTIRNRHTCQHRAQQLIKILEELRS